MLVSVAGMEKRRIQMNKLVICACVVVLALQLHSVSAGNNCPSDAKFLISETIRASDIHREWLDKGWSKDRDWDNYWMNTHMETAVALAQATVGCK